MSNLDELTDDDLELISGGNIYEYFDKLHDREKKDSFLLNDPSELSDDELGKVSGGVISEVNGNYEVEYLGRKFVFDTWDNANIFETKTIPSMNQMRKQLIEECQRRHEEHRKQQEEELQKELAAHGKTL